MSINFIMNGPQATSSSKIWTWKGLPPEARCVRKCVNFPKEAETLNIDYLGLTLPLTIYKTKNKKTHYILLIQPSMITDCRLNMQKDSRDLKMQKTNISLLTRSKLQYNMPSSYTTSKKKDSRVKHQFCLGAGRWKYSSQRMTLDLGLWKLLFGLPPSGKEWGKRRESF